MNQLIWVWAILWVWVVAELDSFRRFIHEWKFIISAKLDGEKGFEAYLGLTWAPVVLFKGLLWEDFLLMLLVSALNRSMILLDGFLFQKHFPLVLPDFALVLPETILCFFVSRLKRTQIWVYRWFFQVQSIVSFWEEVSI